MKNNLTGRTGVKILAIVLLFVGEVVALISGLGVYGAAYVGAYTSKDFFTSSICRQQAHSEASYLDYVIWAGEYNTPAQLQDYLDRNYQEDMTNFGVQILDADTGISIAESVQPSVIGASYVFGYGTYNIRVQVSSEMMERDSIYEAHYIYNLVQPLRYVLIAALVLGCALFLTCLIFLFCAVGHRRDQEGIVLNAVDRIPLDLLAAIYFFISCFAVMVTESSGMEWLLLGIAVVMWEIMALSLSLSFATRMKAGAFWKNTVIYRLLIWTKKAFGAVGRWLLGMFRALPMVWKSVVVLIGICFVELILVFGCAAGSGFAVLLFLAVNGCLFLAACYALLQVRRLQMAGERLAGGDFDYKLDTSKMYWEFKKHGDNLNAIGSGMGIAVNQKMKSERLKTELITNVSHDIKTPLTSIINYADLLQQAHLTEEQRQDYLETLSRQSRRLKKLTEDLVEASKASTGNIQVALVPTNVEEIINQAVAEYADRLAAGKLEAVVQMGEADLTVQADGRLLWRTLDNLLGNASKYALPGTRVYLDARPVGETVVISVKNVSRDPLNISTDELMERFVRGDTARTTEGSGLGLSIARSLTELQKGRFSIVIDGDLFKAEITLKQ